MHKLTIKKGKHGAKLFLDDFELQTVTGYELNSITPQISELVLRLNVSNTEVLADNSGGSFGHYGDFSARKSRERQR